MFSFGPLLEIGVFVGESYAILGSDKNFKPTRYIAWDFLQYRSEHSSTKKKPFGKWLGKTMKQ
jgi:hypothetical protein